MAMRRVAFDAPVAVTGAGGVVATDWVQARACWATVIYQRGGEVVEAARLEGRHVYKLRLRSVPGARMITTDWRMRDLGAGAASGEFPGEPCAILQVDARGDRRWVFVTVEAGRQP